MLFIVLYCGALAIILVLYGFSSLYNRGGQLPETPGGASTVAIDRALGRAHGLLNGSRWRWLIITLGVVCVVLTGISLWRGAQPAPGNPAENWVVIGALALATAATIVIVAVEAIETTKVIRDIPSELAHDVDQLFAAEQSKLLDVIKEESVKCHTEKRDMEQSIRAEEKADCDTAKAQVRTQHAVHMLEMENKIRAEEKAGCDTAKARVQAQHTVDMKDMENERKKLHEFTERSIRDNENTLGELDRQITEALSEKEAYQRALAKSQKRRGQAHKRATAAVERVTERAVAAEAAVAEAAAAAERSTAAARKAEMDKQEIATTIREQLGAIPVDTGDYVDSEALGEPLEVN
jgi:hypothetical protein